MTALNRLLLLLHMTSRVIKNRVNRNELTRMLLVPHLPVKGRLRLPLTVRVSTSTLGRFSTIAVAGMDHPPALRVISLMCHMQLSLLPPVPLVVIIVMALVIGARTALHLVAKIGTHALTMSDRLQTDPTMSDRLHASDRLQSDPTGNPIRHRLMCLLHLFQHLLQLRVNKAMLTLFTGVNQHQKRSLRLTLLVLNRYVYLIQDAIIRLFRASWFLPRG